MSYLILYFGLSLPALPDLFKLRARFSPAFLMRNLKLSASFKAALNVVYFLSYMLEVVKYFFYLFNLIELNALYRLILNFY